MYNLSELISKPVIDISDGRVIGTLENAVFSKKLSKVRYLVIFNENREDKIYLPSSYILNAHRQAIMAKSSPPEIENAPADNSPLKAEVYLHDGLMTDVVTDIILSQAFAVEKLSLQSGADLDIDDILSFSTDTVIVCYDKTAAASIKRTRIKKPDTSSGKTNAQAQAAQKENETDAAAGSAPQSCGAKINDFKSCEYAAAAANNAETNESGENVAKQYEEISDSGETVAEYNAETNDSGENVAKQYDEIIESGEAMAEYYENINNLDGHKESETESNPDEYEACDYSGDTVDENDDDNVYSALYKFAELDIDVETKIFDETDRHQSAPTQKYDEPHENEETGTYICDYTDGCKETETNSYTCTENYEETKPNSYTCAIDYEETESDVYTDIEDYEETEADAYTGTEDYEETESDSCYTHYSETDMYSDNYYTESGNDGQGEECACGQRGNEIRHVETVRARPFSSREQDDELGETVGYSEQYRDSIDGEQMAQIYENGGHLRNIVTQFNYLIGRKTTADICNQRNEVIVRKNTVITMAHLDTCRRYGKIIALARYCKSVNK